MRTKGVGFDTRVVKSSCPAGNDIAVVTIHCRDLREDASDVEKTMTFKEKASKLFPEDCADDFTRAYNQIEGRLLCMGINEACHAHVIDSIFECSDMNMNMQRPLRGLKLDVFVELTDVYSIDYVPDEPSSMMMWWETMSGLAANLNSFNSRVATVEN